MIPHFFSLGICLLGVVFVHTDTVLCEYLVSRSHHLVCILYSNWKLFAQGNNVCK